MARGPTQKLPSTAIYCHFGAAKPLRPLQLFHSFLAGDCGFIDLFISDQGRRSKDHGLTTTYPSSMHHPEVVANE